MLFSIESCFSKVPAVFVGLGLGRRTSGAPARHSPLSLGGTCPRGRGCWTGRRTSGGCPQSAGRTCPSHYGSENHNIRQNRWMSKPSRVLFNNEKILHLLVFNYKIKLIF